MLRHRESQGRGRRTPLHPLCLRLGRPDALVVGWRAWSGAAPARRLRPFAGRSVRPLGATASPAPPRRARRRVLDAVVTLSHNVSLSRRAPGIRIFCTEERSQGKNKERAFALLRSRLFELEQEKQRSAEAAKRKSQARRGAPARLGRVG